METAMAVVRAHLGNQVSEGLNSVETALLLQVLDFVLSVSEGLNSVETLPASTPIQTPCLCFRRT